MTETGELRWRRTTLIGAAAGLVAVAIGVLAAQMPVAWLLLGISTVLSLAVLADAAPRRGYFEPMTVVAAFVLLAFCVRPLFVFLHSRDLLSWVNPQGRPAVQLEHIEQQTTALFASTLMHGHLSTTLTRAIAASTLFIAATIVGYSLPAGRRLAKRWEKVASGLKRPNVKFAIVASFVLGLIGQVAAVGRAGGVSSAANNQLKQTALGGSGSLGILVLASFTVAGIVIWAAWDWPKTKGAAALLALAVMETCVFDIVVGSRTRVVATLLMVVVVAHMRWRPLSGRIVAMSLIIGILLSTALLGVRQATYDRPFSKALSSAPQYIEDPRGLINNIAMWDQLFFATSAVGSTLHFKYGGWFVAALHSYVPRFIDPHKPNPSDVVIRQQIFHNEVFAGLPPTLPGDLYYDFGFFGIAFGSILLGFLCRGMGGLLSGAGEGGAAYRAALYSILLFILYEFVSTTYSDAIGFAITVLVPFLAAVHIIGRFHRGGAPAADGAS